MDHQGLVVIGHGSRLSDALRVPPSPDSPMPNKDRSNHEPPEKPGGEGWLFSEQHQLLSQFRPSTATVHAKWVEIRTFNWSPPRQPTPQILRRLLLHNAIEAWETMLKTGLVLCRPPVRLSDWRILKTFPNPSEPRNPMILTSLSACYLEAFKT